MELLIELLSLGLFVLMFLGLLGRLVSSNNVNEVLIEQYQRKIEVYQREIERLQQAPPNIDSTPRLVWYVSLVLTSIAVLLVLFKLSSRLIN